MISGTASKKLDRRIIIKAAAAAGFAQLAAPFVLTARAADSVKIGLDTPLTGTFAALGKNELIGAQLAIEQINAKGGILDRKVELLVEDSTSGDTATAVQKALKLIDRDKVDFLIGNINSALAQAMANTSFQKGMFQIVPGGHTDSVTGTQCHWNVFRVCNTTRMETNSVSKVLLDKYGKKWYFITTDYAFGHSLQEGFEASLKAAGGTELGADYSVEYVEPLMRFLIRYSLTTSPPRAGTTELTPTPTTYAPRAVRYLSFALGYAASTIARQAPARNSSLMT